LQREVLGLLAPELLEGQSAEAVERFAFYDRARAAYAIVLTGEGQPFGNFILRKGVIGEALRP
jgi:L-fucose mutarotase